MGQYHRHPSKLSSCQKFLLFFILTATIITVACGASPGTSSNQSALNAAMSNSALVAQPNVVDFGNTTTAPSTRMLVLTNRAHRPVTVLSVQSAPAGVFQVADQLLGREIGPAQTLALKVRFSPLAEASYAGALILRSQMSSSSNSNQRERSAIGQLQSSSITVVSLKGSAKAKSGGGGGSGSGSGSGSGQNISLVVWPTSASLGSGATKQFQARVSGSSNNTVTWTAQYGTVNSAGLYQSPSVTTKTIDTVSAVSAADASVYATASVLVYPQTAPPPPSNASDYYVSMNGSDRDGDGSLNSPWATIQTAVERVTLGTGGAVIHVLPGTYPQITNGSTCPTCTCSGLGFGNVNVCVDQGGSSPAVRLIIQCDQKWQCKIGGGTYGFLVVANNVDITGFDIGNTAGMAAGVMSVTTAHTGLSTMGNSLHVVGNYIHDFGSSAYGPEGTGCPQTGAISFNNHHGAYMTDQQAIGNFITRMGRYPFLSCHNTHGIYANTSAPIVENNIIAQVPTAGIMIATAGCGAKVSNNTVMSAQAGITIYGSDAGTTGCVNGAPGLNTVDNNIVVNMSNSNFQLGAPSSQQCTSATPNYFGSNITDGVGVDFYSGPYYCDTVPGSVLHAAPTSIFASYQPDGSGDYTLSPSSPALNRGTTQCAAGQSNCVPSVDFNGADRPQGAGMDVGAYEQ